ncbi:MAG: hypothetical protein ACLF0G_04275 [Candidatus Brocadiia bacterium]
MALLTLAATAGAAATGRLAGTVSPPGRALKVGVVERIPATIKALRDKRRWGRLDQATGKYVVDNLAPGKYDLVVETPRGRIEGVELSVRGEAREPTYDLNVGTGQLSVQRFDISEYIEEGQLLTDTERDALIRRKLRIDKLLERVEKTLKVARFMDANRPLYVHGTRRRAVVLMELARKDRFYAEKGDQVIWRVESWPFLWRYDVWHKPNKGLTVWQRMRVPASEFARMGYVFDPALGGIEVKAGETTTFDLTLPEELPSSLGKVPQ